MKHHCGPSTSPSRLQGLILPCLCFPPCPHLLKIVTHPEDGELGEGFLPLLRKASGLGVLIPSQVIPHSPGLYQTAPLPSCWGRYECGMEGDHPLQLEAGGAAQGQ